MYTWPITVIPHEEIIKLNIFQNCGITFLKKKTNEEFEQDLKRIFNHYYALWISFYKLHADNWWAIAVNPRVYALYSERDNGSLN